MKHVFLFIIGLAIIFISCEHGTPQGAIDNRPNFMIIMLDDLGYSDLGCYGGEIQTPNIDAIAQNGIRFTQMYNCARCCPTRASLLTGKYPHQVGLKVNGKSLSRNSPTLAEVLKENGYHTGMAGKWHLSQTKAAARHENQIRWMAHQVDLGPFAPVESYPSNRGFEEHWGVIWGVVNYFDPFSLVHNEKAIREVEEDFYMTDFITDKSIELIRQFNHDEQPFFIYVAHTAPHWPLHARPEDKARYKDRYAGGWDKLRSERYARMAGMGLIDPDVYALPSNTSEKAWDDCEQKAMEADYMATHAAMVDRVDQGVGRIIEVLKETGEFENTVIFVLSDNGASPERGYPPGFDRPGITRDSVIIQYNAPTAGPETTWCYLGDAWANAVNTPFRYWKKESFEGGICTPFIIHWPAGLPGKAHAINRGVAHVMDLLPTCLELSGTAYPEQFNGRSVLPPEGSSLWPLINQKMVTTHDTLFWEHMGGRGVRIGNWKMAALNGQPWELFNLSADRTETVNLADQQPQKVLEMEAIWMDWAKEMGIAEQ